MTHLIPTIGAVITLLAPLQEAPPQDSPSWPMELYGEEATIVLYQPQLEKLEGDQLSARAAVSVTPKGEKEATFGAVWFDSRIDTDRAARTVEILDVTVTGAKFPEQESDPAKLEKLSALLTKEVQQSRLTLSLDQLMAALDTVEKKDAGAELKDDPPKIVFKTHPALLILLDGPPQLAKIEGSPVKQVVNSPYLIFFETEKACWYMTDGSAWLSAPDVKGPWKTEPTPPTSVLLVMSIQGAGAAETNLEADKQPEIVVATEPTELISLDGEPQYTPLGSTGLLYVANTDSHVFRDVESKQVFALLSGRWYATSSPTEGPWTHVPPDQLPAGFAQIPPDSEKAEVLSSVAGTQPAKDAVQETYVPRTAAIQRGATIQVEYDGEPQFVDIEKTSMAYAENSGYAVVRVAEGGTKYYCCHEAVWFCAESPNGPWVVCTSVPDVIYTIPPSCPVYNVTYVRVYDSTPEVVHVGYYPGYVGCYPYRGVIVYGTGWYYRPWWRSRYYARHCTWGFGVRYNPWTGGWRVGVGYRGHYGGVSVAVGGGWWAGGRRSWSSTEISRSVTTPRGTWSSATSVERKPGKTEVDRKAGFTPSENIYARRDNRERVADKRRGAREPGLRPGERGAERPESRPRTPTAPGEARVASRQRENNVYADRSGNVHRRTAEGWQSRDKQGGWTEHRPEPRSREMERSHVSRERGVQRRNEYHRRSTGFRGGRGRR